MQTVKASVILEDAYRGIGWDADQLETRQKQMAREALSMALQEVWESWWWQELMQCAEVAGATVYTIRTEALQGTVWYWPETQKYYQAVRYISLPVALMFGAGVAPTINGAVNDGWWAEAKASYDAEDWAPATDYALGDQARCLVDGLTYSCSTAHTSGTAWDGTNWGELVPFTPEVVVTGEVRAVGKADPRNSNNAWLTDVERTLTGWRLPGWELGAPWVWYRRPTPILTGDDYSATATYEASAETSY